MNSPIQIQIGGHSCLLGSVTYDVNAVQHRIDKGPLQYTLSIDRAHFCSLFLPLYDESKTCWENEHYLREDLFEGDLPDFATLVDNPHYLKTVMIEWFDYRMLDLFLKRPSDPKYVIWTMDDIQASDESVNITGTADKRRHRMCGMNGCEAHNRYECRTKPCVRRYRAAAEG